MSDDKKPFTVTDRRHFTPDGAPREEAAPAPPSAPPQQTPASPPESARRETAAQPAPPAAETPRAPEPGTDFTSFILSLAAQAGALLAGPEEGALPTVEDLRGVRALIAILEMLKDKTHGRRTPDEERVLEGVLYELRLGYLERGGGATA